MSLFLDDNLEQQDDGTVACRHCSTAVSVATDPLRDALVRETPSRNAAPSIRADASLFSERPIVLRVSLCPECLTQLQAEIVPGDEASFRRRAVSSGA